MAGAHHHFIPVLMTKGVRRLIMNLDFTEVLGCNEPPIGTTLPDLLIWWCGPSYVVLHWVRNGAFVSVWFLLNHFWKSSETQSIKEKLIIKQQIKDWTPSITGSFQRGQWKCNWQLIKVSKCVFFREDLVASGVKGRIVLWVSPSEVLCVFQEQQSWELMF